VRGRDRVGRVTRNADGSFTGIIRGVEVTGCRSWEDALNQLVAEVEGRSVVELGPALIDISPVQKHTKTILDFLRSKAKASGGRLVFTNEDLVHARTARRTCPPLQPTKCGTGHTRRVIGE